MLYAFLVTHTKLFLRQREDLGEKKFFFVSSKMEKREKYC